MIRSATLDDASGISKLFRAGIENWQRMDENGQVLDLPYEDLRIYERWLHGGAWMSIETGAVWLNHLFSGGIATVLDDNGIRAYAETYLSRESEPFAYHLHIGELVADSEESRDKLMQALLIQAKNAGRITAACNAYDVERLSFYRRYGLNDLQQLQQLSVPAQGGHVGFYKVTVHGDADANQIKDWGMPIGRKQSARQHWEELWPRLWLALPEIEKQTRHRLRFNVAGQDAFVCLQQHQYDPRTAEVYCWTPKALSGQLIGAIRDWAYKASFRSLSLTVNEATAKLLGNELEASPYQQLILMREL